MHLIQIRYSLRSLARDPTFACVVILVLSLGIAVNTTVFSVIDQVVFKSLPYKDPRRLLMVWESNPALGEPAGSRVPAAWSNFVEWRNQSQSFQAIEAFERVTYTVTGLREPELVTAARATGGYFRMLGVNAERGRILTPEDSEPGASAVAVVTDAFREAHFAGENGVGRKLLLDGVPYIIVGVLPKEFHLPMFLRGAYEYKPEIWVPMPATMALGASKFRKLLVSARLKNSSSFPEARAEMAAVAKSLEQIDPELNKGYGINLVPIKIENADPDFERALYVLWAASFGVLLLGCANLAGLISVRAMTRQKDLAIMKALGAPKPALIANVLSHGALLLFAAALLAVLGSYAGVDWIRAVKPGDLAGAERLSLSFGGFLFAGGVFLFCILIFGLLPAWLSTRQPPNAVLRRSVGALGSAPGAIIRPILVCGEVAIALALAIGAMLLIRSFQELLHVDPGYRVDNVLTARIALPQSRFPDRMNRILFCKQVLDKVRQSALVQSASLVDNFPLYSIHYTFFELQGRPTPDAATPLSADFANVTADFFETMGTPLRRGRLFTPEDMEDTAEKVAILNESLAHKLWPNEDPIGSHIRTIVPHQAPGPWRRVIGIVGDFRQFNLDTPPRPEMFWPAREYSEMTLVVRTLGEPVSFVPSLRGAISAIDSEQPLSDVQTLRHMVDHSIAQRRFNTLLLSGFAGLGIALALLGVYGLISYIVAAQTRDIGIRSALGAQPHQILRALISRILCSAAGGLVLGLLVSFLMRKVIAHLIFRINALDPVTYLSLPAVLMMLILVACLRPAWRASRLQPANILRHE